MDAKLNFQTKNHLINGIHRPSFKPSTSVLAVLSKPPEKHINLSTNSHVVYKDNLFDRLAIHHLSQSLQSATGLKSKKSGYDGLLEAATVAYRSFTASQQRQVVIQTLETAFPRPILDAASLSSRRSFQIPNLPESFFAVFTTLFFTWLVGPCEVRESEFEGKMEKNVVHIKKCRFLEGTNCVGMCTNLCKMPSQAFIKDSLSMPFNMVPNFDDMSCDMIFGQHPPSPMEDPAFSRPCYNSCKEETKHSKSCPTGTN